MIARLLTLVILPAVFIAIHGCTGEPAMKIDPSVPLRASHATNVPQNEAFQAAIGACLDAGMTIIECDRNAGRLAGIHNIRDALGPRSLKGLTYPTITVEPSTSSPGSVITAHTVHEGAYMPQFFTLLARRIPLNEPTQPLPEVCAHADQQRALEEFTLDIPPDQAIDRVLAALEAQEFSVVLRDPESLLYGGQRLPRMLFASANEPRPQSTHYTTPNSDEFTLWVRPGPSRRQSLVRLKIARDYSDSQQNSEVREAQSNIRTALGIR
ncbi:MAG: hypothetical protein IT436_04050 [Phycisphaerales bacterium]|nr:hypothetical protein [Phycisphaerales bacterium]